MAKISKDPATEVTCRGDPGVLPVLPAPTFGCCAQALALQKTEAEAGNGILFLLVFVTHSYSQLQRVALTIKGSQRCMQLF